MGRQRFPGCQPNQQKNTNNSDPEADVFQTGPASEPLIDHGPEEHDKHDESHAQHRGRSRKEFQPAEGGIEEPFRFDVLRRCERIGFWSHRGRKQRCQDTEENHQRQTGDQLGVQMVREEIEMLRCVGWLVLKFQFADALQSQDGDVGRDQQDQNGRQNGSMQNVEPGHRVLIVRLAGQQQLLGIAANIGHGVADIGSHGGAPITELLENKTVSGKADDQGRQQQTHPDHPVDVARFAVGSREVDSHLVQNHGGNHQRGGPFVNASDVPTVVDLFRDALNRLIGCFRGRLIVERQQDACHNLDNKQIGWCAAQAPPPAAEVIRHRFVRQFGQLDLGDRQPFAKPLSDSTHGVPFMSRIVWASRFSRGIRFRPR